MNPELARRDILHSDERQAPLLPLPRDGEFLFQRLRPRIFAALHDDVGHGLASLGLPLDRPKPECDQQDVALLHAKRGRRRELGVPDVRGALQSRHTYRAAHDLAASIRRAVSLNLKTVEAGRIEKRDASGGRVHCFAFPAGAALGLANAVSATATLFLTLEIVITCSAGPATMRVLNGSLTPSTLR